jgi:SAM-dependent methyltransferase
MGPVAEIEPWSREAAELYDLIHRSDDYRALAERVHGFVQRHSPGATSLIDVACGTGRCLEELRRWYEVEGVDLSPAVLELARQRLPDVPLHEADMREFDLGRMFDAVTCLSSSIAWMLTPTDLDRAVANMARHLREDGVLVLEPWDSPEDAHDGRRTWVTTAEEPGRVVAMMETTELSGDVWVEDSHYLIWTEAGGIRHGTEHTRLGAFTRADYENSLRRAGLKPHYDPDGLLGRGLHMGVKGRDR